MLRQLFTPNQRDCTPLMLYYTGWRGTSIGVGGEVLSFHHRVHTKSWVHFLVVVELSLNTSCLEPLVDAGYWIPQTSIGLMRIQ